MIKRGMIVDEPGVCPRGHTYCDCTKQIHNRFVRRGAKQTARQYAVGALFDDD